jgi:hypothetical protein
VGFHTNPSDIKIAFVLVYLHRYVEFCGAALFKKNALSKHMHVYIMPVLTATLTS